MSQLHTSNSKSTGLSTTSPSHAPYLTGTPSATPNGTHAKPKPKPMNVFTNDGSFLDRFQRQKKGEEDKSKQEEIMNRKKNFEDRFKNRGKRIRTDESENTSPSETSPTSPVSSTADDDSINSNPAKKPKFAEPTVASNTKSKSN